MKKTIYAILMCVSILIVMGSAGACDMGEILISRAIIQALLGLAGVWIFGKLANVIE